MQRLEVSGAVRHIYASLGFKGLISGLWGGHNLSPSWRSGNRCDITPRLNASYRKSRTTFAVCRRATVCKLSVCKEPTLYESVHEKFSESLLHSLFLHKTIQLLALIYGQLSVVRHFTNWWHLSHFPWTTAFTRTFATSILWCYSFNGMIKRYDISCATLCNFIHIILKGCEWEFEFPPTFTSDSLWESQ